ncbi:MAG: PilT/PilU family type 4a pilus ATPase [Lentisphaeria bacterium]|nr:PilT/PilU family type 4a pilus ATPase [Lentisphaeria bacterium]
MPLDIQWFIFALISNGAITQADADRFYQSLEGGPELEAYAQLVLDQLVAGLSEEDQQSVLDQIQAVIDYAVAQAETGIAPNMPQPAQSARPAGRPGFPGAAARSGFPGAAARPGFPPAQRAAAFPPAQRAAAFPPAQRASYMPQQQSVPAAPEEPGDDESGPKKHKRSGIVQDSATRFERVNIDLSQIQSYEDLPSLRNVSEMSDPEIEELVITLLTCLRALGASDLHISAGSPAFVRRMLQIERIDDWIIPEEDAWRLNTVLLSPERRKRFEEEMDINFALEVGPDRFRVCLMMQKDGSAASYRLVPDHICSLEELGFLDNDITHIKRLLDYHNGLVLVTGPIGSGKTTTLAAMVDIINEKRTDHIITVEDPIEILQPSKNCQVTQREIGKHTISYRSALKAALREDPDVIVIGELHDLETIENAITASETGHLVIGTLHTSDAANTLNRLLDVFPPSQQPQIRAMTAGSLRGIVCQRLIPAETGGLTIGYEILINNMAVANIISEGKAFKLKSTMQIGNKQGMCTLDQCLLGKYKAGLISYEVAKYYMHDQAELTQLDREFAIRQAQQLRAN